MKHYIVPLIVLSFVLGGCEKRRALIDGPTQPFDGGLVPVPVIQPVPGFEAAYIVFKAAHPELTAAECITQFTAEWNATH